MPGQHTKDSVSYTTPQSQQDTKETFQHLGHGNHTSAQEGQNQQRVTGPHHFSVIKTCDENLHTAKH